MTHNTIIKIGALIFNEHGQMLAVHKKGKPALELIVPGGKKEIGESDEQTLRRELWEELHASVKSFTFYDQFEDVAIYENQWLIMKTYLVTLETFPIPSNEIDQIIWLGADYRQSGYQFASILGKQILPKIFPKNDEM